jgi:hypothetical protein
MSLELKIKSKHLTEEAKIIRFEENKLLRQVRYLHDAQREEEASGIFNKWYSLNTHRRQDVRVENRATYLARAFIAGKEYYEIEQKRSPEMEYDFQTRVLPRLTAMVNKYGPTPVVIDTIKKWATPTE